eukprot:1161481-Pelagomonas_calceolata.AAC.10
MLHQFHNLKPAKPVLGCASSMALQVNAGSVFSTQIGSLSSFPCRHVLDLPVYWRFYTFCHVLNAMHTPGSSPLIASYAFTC